MARTIDTATIELVVNGSQAQQTIVRLTQHGENLRKQLAGAINAGDISKITALRKEMAKNDAELKNMQAATQRIRKTMEGLDKATPKQLRDTIREINRQLNSGEIERGSKEWEEYTDALKKAKAELQEIKNEQKAAGETLSGNKLLNFASIATVATSATNAVGRMLSTMRQYVDEYADIAEHMAAVTKYTGLSKDEVAELNEAFKKMDTRTTQAALNDLAADAGRLGLTARQDILDFVEAADQINTALGEDLGDGAVKNIGKLAQLFGDSDRMGLKQAMLATGSVINDLAQSSSAAEGYIMDFTQRLSGMANTAGMSQAQVMGLASVLDQANVQAEVGATALSNVIQKMYKSPAAFAAAAKIDLQDFTQTLKTDANGALLMFAEGLGSLGDMEDVAKALASLRITGAGVSQTLTALAGNTTLVRDTQRQAAEAFKEATSVTNEAAAANSTVQARLEKAREKLAQTRAEIGERLLPAYTRLLSGVTGFWQVLSILISFLTRHIALFGSLAAAMAAYNAVLAAATVRQKLHNAATAAATVAQNAWKTAVLLSKAAVALLTGNIGKATAAMRTLNTVTKSSPWGLLIGLIAGVVSYLVLYKKKTDEAAEAQKALTDIKAGAAAKMEEERQKIERLISVAQDETQSLKNRKTAVAELNRIIPGYNAQIDTTTGKYRASKKALDGYLSSLQRKYELEGAKDMLKEIGREKADLRIRKEEATDKRDKIQQKIDNAGKSNSYAAYGTAGATMQAYVSVSTGAGVIRAQQEIDGIERKLKDLEKREKLITGAYGGDLEKDALSEAGGNGGNGSGGNGGNGGNGSGGTGRGTSGGGGSDDPAAAIERRAEAARIAAEVAYESGLTSLREYRDAAYQIEQQSIQDQQALYKEGSPEWNELELQRLKSKKKYMEESTEEQRKAEEQDEKEREQRQRDFAQKAAGIRSEYLKKPVEEQMADELALLDQLHQQELFSEEEYQKARAAIINKYKEQTEGGAKKWDIDTSGMDSATAGVAGLATAVGQLSEKLKSGEASWQDYMQVAMASLTAVSSMLSSASALVSANASKEEAEVTARYDAEIEKAGSTTAKGKKLEEKKQAELAKIKNKYNKREMAMEIAQAVAQTAIAALAAYTSVMKGVPYPANTVLAPAMAAVAVASGMVQVAAIKKQHDAAAAGYYEGGFTADIGRKKVAGVVHGGEFVASAAAVSNPALAPVFSLIDHAQKNNTVASLTPRQVSRSLTAAQRSADSTAVTADAVAAIAPAVVQEGAGRAASGEAQAAAIAAQAATARDTARQLARLADQLEKGITAYAEISGTHGIASQLEKYNRLRSV